MDMWKSAIVFAFLLPAGSEASQSQGLNGTPGIPGPAGGARETYPQLN